MPSSMNNKVGFILAAAIIFAGCSSQPMYTETDVLKAKNKGELYSLYDAMALELKEEKPSSERAANIRQYREKVGEEIANEKEQAVLNELGRDLENKTVAQLNDAKTKAGDIQQYDQEVYLNLLAVLNKQIHEKEKQIATKRSEYDLLELDGSLRKVELLNEMAEIAGGDEAAKLQAEKQTYINSLFTDAQREMDSQRYEQVVKILDQLELINDQDEKLQTMRYALIEAEYEQQFWDALGSGDKEKSFELLKHLTAIPNYLQKNEDILPIAKDLEALYLADADKKMQSLQVIAAYEDYSKANFIQQQLGTVKIYSEGEKTFIRIIENKFADAQEAGELELSYGLLSIIEELQFDNVNVIERSPNIINELLNRATVKVLPRQLNSKPEALAVSEVFSNALAAQLQKTLKTRVEVLDLGKQQKLTQDEVALNPAAWFEITGDLQTAKVTSGNEAISETKNVLVSHRIVENPEHIEWAQLSKRKKRETTEPASTIEQPVYEDVVIQKVEIQKQADINVSYRLIDSSRQAVLFFDAQKNQVVAKGVAQKAYEKGLFKLEAQEAQIPLEADMMGQVIAEAVVEMSIKLEPELIKLDSRYKQMGALAFTDSNFNESTKQYAYADVLATAYRNRQTKEESSKMKEKLRFSAIRWK